MINGGNATVYVSNMDQAVTFYTEVLGLKLTNRFGNHWATVQAGKTLVIGLHPWSKKYPRPGTRGSVQIGLVVSRDLIESAEANYIHFTDPDGNPIYVGDWDPDADAVPQKHETVSSTTR